MRAIATIIATVAILAVFVAGAAHGQGQQVCGPRADIADSLEKAYGERLRVQAVRDSGSVLLIFVSDNDMSYTVASLNPASGIACILDTGSYWSLQKTAPSREG